MSQSSHVVFLDLVVTCGDLIVANIEDEYSALTETQWKLQYTVAVDKLVFTCFLWFFS